MFAAAVAACLLTGVMAERAFADIPATRIVIEPPVAHPGDQVTIHGAYLWTDSHVVISIVGRAGASRTIGSATTFGDGSLEANARVPSDMPDGRFRVVVTSEAGDFVDVELVVEAPFPVIPAFSVLGGVMAALFVARSMWHRRAAGRHPPAG
ncbi:MAG: hypothetical protein EPO00_02645 [Chloroflexota bacterium]|nr:MAG: hypothetical protein EPO00_02645 [Chloroflexota bacterium]